MFLCADCACTLTQLEDGLVDRCLLDAWHAKKHVCSRKLFDPHHRSNKALVKDCNTQAAEQLWSRTDKLAGFCMHLRRSNYRLFLKSYCVWRNGFVRSGMRRDTNPCKSWKSSIRRNRVTMNRPAASGSGSAPGSRKRPASAR